LFPDTTERLGDECFKGCESLDAAVFGAGPRLVDIRASTFVGARGGVSRCRTGLSV